MATEIWRLNSFAVWIEATPWVSWTLDAYIPYATANLKTITTNIKDDSALWIIDEFNDAHITQKYSQFTAEWIARSNTIWYLLLLALWTAWAPTLIETWVYSHAFTRLNSNSHPSATIYRDNATQDETALYHMVNTFGLTASVWDYVKFNVDTIWKAVTNTTLWAVSFVAWDEQFLVSKMQIKFASNIAWLAWATPVWVNNLKFTINKNLKQIYKSAVSATEALEFASQHNQNFSVAWDIEIVYDADTYKTLAQGLTKQAMQIEITWRSLIWATKYNSLIIQFDSIVLENWDRSTDKNAIVNQTFGFTALYSTAWTETMNAVLQNTKNTIYA